MEKGKKHPEGSDAGMGDWRFLVGEGQGGTQQSSFWFSISLRSPRRSCGVSAVLLAFSQLVINSNKPEENPRGDPLQLPAAAQPPLLSMYGSEARALSLPGKPPYLAPALRAAGLGRATLPWGHRRAGCSSKGNGCSSAP